MDIREMYEQGVSIIEIARRTGRDRKTIRKWVQSRRLPRPSKRKRPRFLDPQKEFVVSQIEFGVTNAVRMVRDLRKRGYEEQIRIVRAFMQPLRPLAEAKVTVRYETEPGRQAQVDWGESGYITEDGCRKRLY